MNTTFVSLHPPLRSLSAQPPYALVRLPVGRAEEIAAGLSRGERLHLYRLANARADGLHRRPGWKGRALMMKGLSEWVDHLSGTERLTPLGREVLAVLEGQ